MKLFIFDFDGTISKEDTTDLILGLPGKSEIWQIEEDWKRGMITSYQCMKAQARFLEGITIDEIHQCLKQHSHKDANFTKLIHFLKKWDFHTIILSEGYDVSINFHQIHKDIKDIYCSKLLIEKGKATGELEVLNHKKWDYNENCIGCCLCKVKLMIEHSTKSNVMKTFAVGDGRSDECLFKYSNVSFSLNPNIEATYQVRDLGDVLKILQKYPEYRS